MSSAKSQRRTGRLVVNGLFGVIVAFFGVAIFGSVLGDLYGSPPSDGVASPGLGTESARSWCARRLAGLHQELERQVTFELDHPLPEGDPLARFVAWQTRWDKQLEQVQSRCDDDPTVQKLRGDLEHIRLTYHDALGSIATARAVDSQELERTLRQLH